MRIKLIWADMIRQRLKEVNKRSAHFSEDSLAAIDTFIEPILDYAIEEESRITKCLGKRKKQNLNTSDLLI